MPASAYEVWRNDPTPENLSGVVSELSPMIKSTVHNIGGGSDPYLQSQARILAAKAVSTYNPEAGASLNTWVSRQLMPLRRIRREKQAPIKIPESVQLDALHLHNVEQEFISENGREPDLYELSDRASMGIPRIEQVRKKFIKTPSEIESSADYSTEDSPIAGAAYSYSDFESEATDYVYAESDYIDRKILEYKTGYKNSPVLDGQQIAQKLGISPAQVTRRAAKLTYKIQNYYNILEKSV
jgi:DNA-directed RNA polymerase specialized sigma subunit